MPQDASVQTLARGALFALAHVHRRAQATAREIYSGCFASIACQSAKR